MLVYTEMKEPPPEEHTNGAKREVCDSTAAKPEEIKKEKASALVTDEAIDSAATEVTTTTTKRVGRGSVRITGSWPETPGVGSSDLPCSLFFCRDQRHPSRICQQTQRPMATALGKAHERLRSLMMLRPLPPPPPIVQKIVQK